MKRVIKFKNSVFTKLVTFFLIIILPVCFIAVGFYNWQIKILDDATVAAFDSNVNNCLITIEKELEKVQSMCLNSLHDEDLIMLSTASSTMSNYKKTLSINRYMSRMEDLKDSSNYIREVNTYIPELSRVINSDRDIFSDEQSLLEVYNVSRSQKEGHFTVVNNELYYVFVPAGTPNGGLPNYILTTQIFKDELRRELATIVGAQAVMLYDTAGAYVSLNLKENSVEQLDLTAIVSKELTSSTQKVDVMNEPAWLVNHQSERLGISLVAYVPTQSINPQMKDLRTYFIVFSTVLIVTVLVLTYMMYKLIKTPLKRLVKAFKEMEVGSLGVRLKHSRSDEFGFLYHSFNSMAAKNQDLMEQVYEQKILAQSAQLKQLQSQINPHFLYNSFFVISNMARLEDFKSIKRFSEYLARYYRFIMQKKDGDIPFKQEVEHTTIYADIQKMRFGERIQIEIGEIPAHASEIQVPRLILQPLVENAFEHGLVNVVEKGLLRITFLEQNNMLTVEVENNGSVEEETIKDLRKRLENDPGEISGIISIHKRLQYRFSRDSGISVSRSDLGGMKISLKICEDKDV